MDTVIGRESMSAQLARIIEKDIFSGKLKPDAPLASTRTLSEAFNVSRQVVVSGLDILEKKDLIVRIPRKGVFVKSRDIHKQAREILFFAFMDRLERNIIFQAMNKISEAEKGSSKYDFFTRFISAERNQSNRLDHELERLANLGYIDCGVIYSADFTADTIRKCVGLPYPIIIVGDLPDGDYKGLQFNQIRPDHHHTARLILNYWRRQKFEQVIFFHSGQIYGKYQYWRDFVGYLEQGAAENSIQLRRIVVPGSGRDEITANFETMAREIVKEAAPETRIFKGDIRSDDFDHGILFPREGYPQIHMLTLNSFATIPYVKRSTSGIIQAISDMIDRTCSSRDLNLQVVIPITEKIETGDCI